MLRSLADWMCFGLKRPLHIAHSANPESELVHADGNHHHGHRASAQVRDLARLHNGSRAFTLLVGALPSLLGSDIVFGRSSLVFCVARGAHSLTFKRFAVAHALLLGPQVGAGFPVSLMSPSIFSLQAVLFSCGK